MRITEGFNEDSEYNICEFKDHVESTFKYAAQMAEARRRLKSIKEQAPNLRRLFLSENEKKENHDAVAAFDERMNKMAAATFNNIEKYQLFSWKELFSREECDGESGDHQ